MTMKYRMEMIYYAESGDVENFIKEIFGKTFNVNVYQGGDASHGLIEIDVDASGNDLEAEGMFILWKRGKYDHDPWGEYLLEPILNQLSEMGHIPAGKWYIRIE